MFIANLEKIKRYNQKEVLMETVLDLNYLDLNAKQNLGGVKYCNKRLGFEDSKVVEMLKIKHKTANLLKKWQFYKRSDRMLDCTFLFWVKGCELLCCIVRRLSCGNPMCPVCGKIGSWPHQQRQRRVRNLILGIPKMMYFVFTWPKWVSVTKPDRGKLRDINKEIFGLLQEHFGIIAALECMHWTGEKRPGLHVHPNWICFDANPIESPVKSPLELRLAKQDWIAIVRRYFGTKVGMASFHYSFVLSLPQQISLIEYVTRSTLIGPSFDSLWETDKKYAYETSRGMNVRWFGALNSKHKKEFLAKYKTSIVPPEPAVLDTKNCLIHRLPLENFGIHALEDVMRMDVVPFDQVTWVDPLTKMAYEAKEKEEQYQKELQEMSSLLQNILREEKV